MPSNATTAGRPERGPTLARLALLACLMATLVFLDEPDRTMFWGSFFDFGHVLLFGLAAVLISGVLAAMPPLRGVRAGAVWALGLTVILGATSEILQLYQPGRDASVGDFLRDAVGATAFLLLRASVAAGGAGRGAWTAGRRVAAAALAIALLAAAAGPFAGVVGDYVQRNRAFPTIAALDGARWERRFVLLDDAELAPKALPGDSVGAGIGSLARLDLKPGRVPGLVLEEPYPDWRGYQRLVFWTYSDTNTPLHLILRIHDAGSGAGWNDWFNLSFTVGRGARLVSVPLDEVRRAPRGRPMNMARIRGVVLYARHLERPTHLYLGPIRLE